MKIIVLVDYKLFIILKHFYLKVTFFILYIYTFSFVNLVYPFPFKFLQLQRFIKFQASTHEILPTGATFNQYPSTLYVHTYMYLHIHIHICM